MICKACGKQFTGAACPHCGIRPDSEGHSDELVRLLKNATDGGGKYREGYEKGLKEGYQNGYVAASRDCTAGESATAPETPVTPVPAGRSFSLKHLLIAAGVCFAAGGLLFGLLLGGLRYRSGLRAGEEQGRASAQAEFDARPMPTPRTITVPGEQGYGEEDLKAEKDAGFADGIVFAFDAAAQARSKAEENRLAEKVSAETAQEPDGPGRGILELQQNLIQLGYDEVVPDGTWNPSTRAALETFRERYGIETAGPEALDRETEERIYIQLGFKDEIGMDPFADRD